MENDIWTGVYYNNNNNNNNKNNKPVISRRAVGDEPRDGFSFVCREVAV